MGPALGSVSACASGGRRARVYLRQPPAPLQRSSHIPHDHPWLAPQLAGSELPLYPAALLYLELD